MSAAVSEPDRGPLFFAVVALSAVNGVLSPVTPVLMLFTPIWYPDLLPVTQSAVLYTASIIVSTVTLMLAGLPAALWERAFATSAFGRQGNLVWLVSVLFLSMPGLARLLP
jgi:uncharacterized protein YqgC (DUF456 family)